MAFEERVVPIYSDGARAGVRALGGQTGMVPVLIHGDLAIWETLAIAETLAEVSHAIWPRDKAERARARSLGAEMQSSFRAVRQAMPQNVRGRRLAFSHNAAVAEDIRRVEEIFLSSNGDWLCGQYSAADVMFAPMAARLRTYDIPLGKVARAYADKLLTLPDVETWSREAEGEASYLFQFEFPSRQLGDAVSIGHDVRVEPVAFDHVGIRVTDGARSIEFYEKLGFVVDETCSNARVAEIVTGHGVRLNLIFNGVARADGKNVLLDIEEKWTGCTHVAFVVKDLNAIVQWARQNAVPITEGPVDWGRRITCFLRDPDGNVLEFNELKQ